MNYFAHSQRNLILLIIFIGAGLLAAPMDSMAQKRGGANKAKHKTHQKQQHKKAHARKVAHHKYKHLPKRGGVVTTLPSGVVIVKHKGESFHVHNGVFYKSKGRAGYTVVRPPIGTRINILPAAHQKMVVQKKAYLYHFGTFYSRESDQEAYQVVEAPVGAEVNSIPDGYEMEEIDGVVYYTLDDAKYMEKGTEAEPVYVVVK
ncbi:MAG: hypothetical protein JKX73_10145 [Flavobacteriales bacterium]|nr:hypothetical protein [Flavobacteriales bacterium]